MMDNVDKSTECDCGVSANFAEKMGEGQIRA